MKSINKQTTTLKWKRLDVWYSAVRRTLVTSFPNRDGGDNLFSWAVNPNVKRKRAFRASCVNSQITATYK